MFFFGTGKHKKNKKKQVLCSFITSTITKTDQWTKKKQEVL